MFSLLENEEAACCCASLEGRAKQARKEEVSSMVCYSRSEMEVWLPLWYSTLFYNCIHPNIWNNLHVSGCSIGKFSTSLLTNLSVVFFLLFGIDSHCCHKKWNFWVFCICQSTRICYKQNDKSKEGTKMDTLYGSLILYWPCYVILFKECIIKLLLPPFQIISHFKNLGESKFFKFDQIHITK